MFNKQYDYFENNGAIFTASEIYQSPEMWAEAVKIVQDKKEELNKFLANVLKQDDYEIIFTGAGTSEFVGNSIFPYISAITDGKAKSYATTDITATPWLYLNKKRYTLLVSFARSGNSPESVATVHLANKQCQNIYHLFITCNKDGSLAKYAKGRNNCFCINLPEKTNDKSFAMTSSYSTMYLSAVTIFMQYQGIDFMTQVNEVIANAQKYLDNCATVIKAVDEFDYKRIVYLGSNCLKGVSQESALKTCELTAGDIMTTYDSCMGFRHGPKSVVKNDSLVVVYLSEDAYTRQYDLDIVKEIYDERIGKLMVVSGKYDDQIKKFSDYYISFNNEKELDTVFLGLEFVLVAQMLGMFKSIKMAITPDNPCSTGQVSRVVHGVIIHDYK